MQNDQSTNEEQMLAMLMAALGVNSPTQGIPNEPSINEVDVLATMKELKCNRDYAIAIENGLLESRVLQNRSGKPAFSKQQLLKAIQEMGNCDPEIAARTLRVMQHASIRPNEIDLEQVPKTMKDISCTPEEAVSVMHNLKVWEHTPNRPLSDVGILHKLFPNHGLKYALDIFKSIEDHEAGRLSEEAWEEMTTDVTRDISELQAEAMEKTGDITMGSMLISEANVESGKNTLEELIEILDKKGETQRKETQRNTTENTASDISKMASSPKKKSAKKKKPGHQKPPSSSKKKNKNKGGKKR